MKHAMIAVMFAPLFLAGCGVETGQKTLAALQSECNAGKLESCRAAGLHSQMLSNDAVVEASIDVALASAVSIGTADPRESRPSYYAQAAEHRH